MNLKKQSNTMIDFSDSCGQCHFVSGDTNASHGSGEEPSHALLETDSSSLLGRLRAEQSLHSMLPLLLGEGCEAGRHDKAASLHQTFQKSAAILQKDQKVQGVVYFAVPSAA